MQSAIDSLEASITCENGHQTKKTVGWLKGHREFSCPVCGQRIRINDDQFRRISDEAAQLDKKLRALSKTIKIRL